MTATNENTTGPMAQQTFYTDEDLVDTRRARDLLTGASALLHPSCAADRINAGLAASMTDEAGAVLAILLARMERSVALAHDAELERVKRDHAQGIKSVGGAR